ncbi:hypothetical protein CONLIGDRAFT_572055 [Coniochaeta ligniaria NRRL 30616]|uniref:Zn(2)-C6 fungal-type domain-containing protein n=1 Tax=Coniochaeta ligniaria NRRL 30616 TaxID=1408157 RepID=A0A1J7IXA4_9PEZI|nr:hypothetical protein CONLIGDRAFT_572055 [Coniochaeta ligniaria NRRL 30616]
MEQSSATQEHRRKHVTTACVTCRESKVKCNGVMPTCSSCLSKGKECRYQAREDKRKLSLRLAIELLHARVQQLSRLLEDNGLEVPPAPRPQDEKVLENNATQGPSATEQSDRTTEPPGNAAPSASNMSSIRVLEDAGGSPQPQQALQGLLELANAAGNTANVMQPPESWVWNMPPEPMPQASVVRPGYVSTPIQQPSASTAEPSGPSCPSLDTDEGTSPTESVDELANQLSDRLGTLHVRAGGHIRFYGPTSNFNLLETQPSDVSMNIHRTVRNDGEDHLARLGVNKRVPPEIEAHLVNLYFTWQDPAFHVVDRKMFEDAKEAWYNRMEDTAYYSEALRNAICALGAAFDARHHPAFVTFPRSLADFFADRAKALLEIELDSPCVATIQALVLLSAHDIGCARDARGWLFSGMATRLSLNLALHHDLKPYIAQGVVTVAEADLRRTVFWAAFVVEHVWSFYLGQPFRTSMKGISLDRPGWKDGPEFRGRWAPYVSPTTTQHFTPVADCVEEVCRHQVLLFEAMAPLSETLYGSPKSSRGALQELNAQTVKELVDWRENLPVELCVELDNHEATYLPHIILLHMQYYQSLIYAHRPWMSKSYMRSQPTQGHDAAHARKTCMDSASAVAQLLLLYEERYTLRRINIQAVAITFSAALLLVFATVTRYQREREHQVLADLSVCFRALDELSPSWDTARRARDFLTRLQRHWERQAKSIAMDRAAAAAAGDNMSAQGAGFPNSRKRPHASVVSNEGDPSMQMRGEMAASLRGDYVGDGSAATFNFGMDLDFDWMLRTSLEGMHGTWSNIISVPPAGPGMPG